MYGWGKPGEEGRERAKRDDVGWSREVSRKLLEWYVDERMS